MTLLFVVVCHDRHSDDGISVHMNRASADRAVAAFKALYADEGVEWTDRDWAAGGSWIFSSYATDSSSTVRIEQLELQGAEGGEE